jgi:hypothetical protein
MSGNVDGSDRAMPPLLQRLNQMDFGYADGEGMEFEPFPDFLSAEDTKDWIRAWTGNAALDGAEYLIFGQDGSGGYAAIWRARPSVPLSEQPIVFFGSEGELGVVAGSLSDYFWLLAGNLGPLEAVSWPADGGTNPAFTAFAMAHATTSAKSPSEILSLARAEFPRFEDDIRALIGY